ncbi:helix-turn-helix domain-containing protein [Allobranchiibius sp. GilTou73]|uniref:helix-turn-helix domain-containing protein n=1 Tax=Allobranchiibius sp. GilTou73 TaxID=2904523 RepID=UPI001F40D462|nr:helix-turn-helix domain-containing protein [Allobranchiibius sp. GilTou73]UIJ34980.1 helix-turn-helix domain-containing protein [Allobranchiibius sp. GilTou73]
MPADLLARSRFVVSPLHEVSAAITLLGRPPNVPWQRAFYSAHRAAFDAMLAEHPVRATLLHSAFRGSTAKRLGWMADFLTVAPERPGMSFQEELDVIAREWDDARVLGDLWEVGHHPPAEILQVPGVHRELLALLEWVWTATVASDWPRRERVLQADIVSRTARLASGGWAAVIPELSARWSWLPDGQLVVSRHDIPPRDLRDALSLSFVPVHSPGTWVSWRLPTHYALAYPVGGALADTGSPLGDGLARLVGGNRARVLRALATPHSTTQLAALTGLPIGSIGGHLRVLLDAGAVLRRRSGREVLYWRTELGDALTST